MPDDIGPDDIGNQLTKLHESIRVAPRSSVSLKHAVHARMNRRAEARRYRGIATVVAAVALAVAGVAVVATSPDGNRTIVGVDTPTTPTTPGTIAPEVTAAIAPPSATTPIWSQSIPDPPLEDRATQLVVTAGDNIFVWGGSVPNHLDGSEPPFSDGAIYDLATDQWRPVSLSPLPGGFAFGLWTGSQIIVSNEGLLASYEPTTDTWQSIGAIPTGAGGAHFLALVGNEVVLPFAGQAWNLDTATWRSLAAVPTPIASVRADMVGGDLILSGGPMRTAGDPFAYRYDADTDSWRELPSLSRGMYEGDATGVVGNELVVVSWLTMAASALNLDTLQWRDLPPFPQLSVKCRGVLEAVDNATAVVSMCGQRAALPLGADRWIVFDPPTKSATFELHRLDTGLLVGGSVLRTDIVGWLQAADLGPIAVAGTTIQRSDQIEVSGLNAGDIVRVDLLDLGCALDVVSGVFDQQRSVAEARADASAAPANVNFFNQFGSYSLSCPTAAAYVRALDSIGVRGERAAPRDVLAMFQLPPTATQEGMFEAAASLITARDRALGRPGSLGLSYPYATDDPPVFIIDSYFTEFAGEGETYTLTLGQTPEGWVIAQATVQEICSRSPQPAATSCG